jgi:NhaP-type Na+/H+ or K+/H+ antiporter
MPIVFVGAGLVPAGAGLALWLAVIALTSLAAGLVVGALHGVVLVWLLEEARDSGSDHDRP